MKKRTGLFLVLLLTILFTAVPVFAGTSTKWVWPTYKHKIQNDWPNYASGGYHGGTDFPVPKNTKVYSSCDGTVILTRKMTSSYGNHIKIKAKVNGKTVYIRYCHLTSFKVKVGQKVKAGELIGLSGATGNASGAHLHYEVRNSKDEYRKALNPRSYLPGTKLSYETIQTVPAPPAITSVQALNHKSIEIKWKGVSDADTYRVERRKSGEETYTKVSELSKSSRAYTDEGLEASTKYFYRVYALNSAGRSAKQTGISATTAAKQNTLDQPVVSSIGAENDKLVKLSWESVPGATVYRVERCIEEQSKTYTLLATVTEITYEDKDIKPGFTHLYRVSAENDDEKSSASDSARVAVPVFEVNRGTDQNVKDGIYQIKLKGANYGLSIASDSKKSGANVHLWTLKETNQFEKFEFKYQQDGFYTIKNIGSGLYLDVSGGTAVLGANVQQYNGNATDAQLWALAGTGDGAYYLVPKCALHTCLDVAGNNKSNGINIQVYPAHGGVNQKFELKAVSQKTGGQKLYEFAKKQVGKKYTDFPDSLKFHYRAWCADFVSWCAKQTGQSKAIPASSSVAGIRKNIKKAGGKEYSKATVKAGKYKPVKGDIIIFKSDGASHVGIVEKISGSTIYYVDGNNTTNGNGNKSCVHYSKCSTSKSTFTCILHPKY